MVNKAYLKLLAIAVASLAVHCNLEVGNPDNDTAGLGGRTSLSSLSLNFSSYTTCTTTADACTSVPVMLSGDEPSYAFEMTSATFNLSSVELQPYTPQAALTSFNLLSGDSIALAQAVDPTQVKAVSLVLAGSKGFFERTYSITGYLLAPGATRDQGTALTLVYSEPITVSMGIDANVGFFDGITFDANRWFDLRGSGNDLRQLFSNLTGGACRDFYSKSCAFYRASLSKLVAQRIAGSAAPRNSQARNEIINRR